MAPQDQIDSVAEAEKPKRGRPAKVVSEAPVPVSIAAPVDNAPIDLNDDIARIHALRDANPFGAFDQKMKLPPVEGYKLHWFNDKPGRVDTAKRAGWTHVNDKDGKPLTLIVDSGGLKAYAMKIPEQFWAEDQARQQAKATAALAAVKKKPDAVSGTAIKPSDLGNFYTPEGRETTITRS